MSIEDDIALLERVPMLRRLGGPALRMLAIGGESLNVSAGEQLFRADEAADGAYIVQKGSFRLRPERAALNHESGIGVVALMEQVIATGDVAHLRSDRQRAQRIHPEETQGRDTLQQRDIIFDRHQR